MNKEKIVNLKLKESEVQRIELLLLEKVYSAKKENNTILEYDTRLVLQSIQVGLRYQKDRLSRGSEKIYGRK